MLNTHIDIPCVDLGDFRSLSHSIEMSRARPPHKVRGDDGILPGFLEVRSVAHASCADVAIRC